MSAGLSLLLSLKQEPLQKLCKLLLGNTEQNGQDDYTQGIDEEIDLSGLESLISLEHAERSKSCQVHEICVERIFAEETRYRIAYVVFHHEDDDRKTEEQEQRHLAEICLDLLFDAGTLAHPFSPVLELHLAE